MSTKDWETLLWRDAMELIRQAERIRGALSESAAAARVEPAWGPAVNVVQGDGTITVVAAIPGVAAGQIEVAKEGDSLAIKGRRALASRVGTGRYLRLEIPFGPFERRIVVPSLASYRLASWRLEDGLLWIDLVRAR
jgi:HSP20 family molecular chaperone IbpA